MRRSIPISHRSRDSETVGKIATSLRARARSSVFVSIKFSMTKINRRYDLSFFFSITLYTFCLFVKSPERGEFSLPENRRRRRRRPRVEITTTTHCSRGPAAGAAPVVRGPKMRAQATRHFGQRLALDLSLFSFFPLPKRAKEGEDESSARSFVDKTPRSIASPG